MTAISLGERSRAVAVPACRLCGCTDANCQRCIERTGLPCWWIEPDLCSTCAVIPDWQRHLVTAVWVVRFSRLLTMEKMQTVADFADFIGSDDAPLDVCDYVMDRWLRLRRRLGGPPRTTPDGRYVLPTRTFTESDEQNVIDAQKVLTVASVPGSPLSWGRPWSAVEDPKPSSEEPVPT